MRLVRAAIVAGLAATFVLGVPRKGAAQTARADVVKTYADIGQAIYEDSLARARLLQKAVRTLVEAPSEEAMKAAREAWLSAREPYMQSEVFRFGNSVVDDWEGKVNAWPLDEGLIDYVEGQYGGASDSNPYYTRNVIANKRLKAGSKSLDAATVSKKLLRDLHEIGGRRGQRRDRVSRDRVPPLGTGSQWHRAPARATGRGRTTAARTARTGTVTGAGSTSRRPASSWSRTSPGWRASSRPAGRRGRISPRVAEMRRITAMLTGLGSLSYGELAGERMKLGLLLHDPEEEHDCFSDNTHNSHYYDIVGMLTVYNGRYMRIDGRQVQGPSLATLVDRGRPGSRAGDGLGKLEATLAAARRLKERAETKERYDQMIGPSNPEGNPVVQAVIDGLVDQTRTFERIVAALKLKAIQFEGSDSLDKPDAVMKK